MAVFRVTTTGIWENQVTCQNVLHFVGKIEGQTELQVAQEIRDGWCAILAAGQTNTFAWRNVTVEKLGSGVGPTNLAINVQGVDAVGPHDGTQILCVKWRIHTTFPGKKGRGRIYLPAFRAIYWSAGQLTPTGITNITSRITAIKARYVGAGATGPIALGVHGRGPEASFHDADDLSLSLTPGVQRRRNLGVGI